MSSKTKNYLCGIFFLLFGIFLYTQAAKIQPVMAKDLGSGFAPKVVAVCIILAAAVELFVTLRPKNAESKAGSNAKKEDNKGGLGTIALICGYAALFDVLGFVITTVVYLFLQFTVLSTPENRNLKLFAVIAAAATIGIYVLFSMVIGMQLPMGILEI